MAVHVKEVPFVMGQKVTATIRGEVFTVGIRGWKRGQYVITDLPKVGGEVYRVAPQTGVQIHFIREGLFVNFKSAASWALTQANSLLVVDFPTKLDMHNLRKFERFKTNLPITFFTQEGEQKFEDSGILYDISSGGVLISHAKEVQKNKTLYLSLELPTGASIKQQKVEVKNIRKNSKSRSDRFITGAKWQKLIPEAEEGIKKFITKRAMDRRQHKRNNSSKF